MYAKFGLAAACSLSLLFAACATYSPRAFSPGTPIDAVTKAMGSPVAEHPLPEGGRRLEYSHAPYGRDTFMIDFDAQGRLVRWEQVASQSHFDAIRAGMTADEVRSRIGTPSEVWSIPRQHQVVWSYRFETPFCQWFMVGIGTENRVKDTSYGPDPMCEVGRDDDILLGLHWRR
jgi:hypothetical protein